MRRLFAIPIFFLALSPLLHGQSPIVDSVDPSQGPIAGGTVVTIRGTNLQDARLWMDKIEIIPQSTSATEIRFTTPGHDNGIASLKAVNSAGSAYGEFIYIPPKLENLPPGYITTVMGIGSFTGLYRQATRAEMQPNFSLAYDRNGNLYITETGYSRVSRVNVHGVLEPYAGNGMPATSLPHPGDGSPALDAILPSPRGVAADSDDNIYIADNGQVRRVDARTGIITTIAGDGTPDYSGDGGPAVQARIIDASRVTVDSRGNIYFIDFDDISHTPRIRKISGDGIISTVAGVAPPGFSGDGGPATRAQFDFGLGGSDCGGLAVDSQGNLYIADMGNNRIRRIDSKTGIVDTIAGPDASADSTGWLLSTSAIAIDRADNIYYYYHNGNNKAHIVKMNDTGQTLAVYGAGVGYSEDGTPIDDVLLSTMVNGMTIDPEGNVVYIDPAFRQVRRINFAKGILETVAGLGQHPIGESGPAVETTLGISDADLAFLPTGDLLIGDAGHFLVRKLDSSGNISTFGGSGAPLWDIRDEISASKASVYPIATEADALGRVFLADVQGIYRLDVDGIMRRIAGGFGPGFSGDGSPALKAELCQPWDVAVDSSGSLFIADTNNNRIRRIDSQTGVITTVAGSGPVNGHEHYGEGTFCGDGGTAIKACLNSPMGVAVDSEGNLFIADFGNNRIRKVDTNGIITTLISESTTKLVVDDFGYLYYSSTFGINRLDRYGVKTRIAGLYAPGFSGDGGPSLQASMRNWHLAQGIAISPEGDIFFVDNFNYRVRAIRYGAVLAPPGAQIRITGGTPQSALTTAAFDFPLQVLVRESSGNPAPSVRVEFSAPSAGPSCTFPNGASFIGIVTDRNGYASIRCTANAQQGSYNVVATPLTASATATFSLTNTVPRAAVGLALTAGSATSTRTIATGASAQSGYVSVGVQSGPAPYGTAVFSYRQNGVTVTEAGVPASPPTRHADIFIDFRSGVDAVPSRSEAGKVDINTGIAVVNYGPTAANIEYTLRHADGTLLCKSHGIVSSGHHFAGFIDQLKEISPDFQLPADFQSTIQFATLEIFSDQPLSIIALRMTTNQRGEALFTTTPVADLTQSPRYSPVYFPQFVDGGGYTTSLILLNTSQTTEKGILEILSSNGAPLIVQQSGGKADSSFSYSIPPGGVFRFQTDGSPPATKAGWVRLIPEPSNASPVGSGVFGYNPGSILVSESGIPSSVSTTHARVYVDLSGGHNTGLAIANVGISTSGITINAFQMDGVTPAGDSRGPLQLAAGGHDAKFADQFFSGLPEGFTGVLDISSSSPFAALALRALYNERDEFLMTTLPVADVDQPAPLPVVFPHIADGGGYTTQFILLSPAGRASTTLSFFAEDGTSLPIGK